MLIMNAMEIIQCLTTSRNHTIIYAPCYGPKQLADCIQQIDTMINRMLNFLNIGTWTKYLVFFLFY